ncbi:MAG TPA: BTAD domain-containing putative transcriptional regulator [Streptosporangiaceae bacterium]|nr:BTAD domain-containing putative transcriptional regulator [Streptosporangiaceae bacterium]
MHWRDGLANADDEPSSDGLAGLVRARRLAAGLTQLQLARAAGVSVGVVRDLEQGRTGQPRRRSVERIAAVLGVGLDPDGGAADVSPAADQAAGEGERTAGAAPGTGAAADGGEPAGGLRLRVLGSLAAWRDGAAVPLGPARQRTVLALLAVQPNSLVRREAICDALWEDDPPATAVSMIQSYVSRLRRLLDPAPPSAGGAGLLAAAGSGYRLQVTGEELDVIAFEQLCARAGAAARAGDPDTACALYERALALWQGEPLADIEVLRSHPAVADLTRRWASAVEEYADAASGQGWHDRVLVPLRALAAREPMNERAHARLMIALAGSGQQAAALEVFDAIRRRLDDQLGIRPGAELAAAHARVLGQHIPAAANLAGPADAGDGPAAAAEGGATSAPAGPTAPAAGAAPGPVGEPAAVELRRAGRRSPVAVVPRQLPAAAPHFVGRACELSSLSRQLRHGPDGDDGVAISVIGGTAGVGKTTLAVTWAHQVAGQFPDGQLYVNLRGYGPATNPIMSPADALRGFLEAFAIPAGQIPASLESLAGMYRSLLSGRRVLVVLDNARDAAQVRPLLPGEAGCAVVITSRSQLTGLVASDGAAPLTLDVLSEADAKELLARRLGASRLADEPDAAAELTGMCARLPLALAITAARAASHPGARLTELVSELDDAVARLDALETGDPDTSVRAVLSWSYENLAPEAARMFRLLALHPGPDVGIPAAASLAAVGPSQATGLLRMLTRAALLTEHAPGRFAFHDLLRAYATELVRATETSGDRRAAGHRVLDHYLHTAHAAAALAQFKREPLALKPPRAGAVPEQLADEESALTWFGAEEQILRAVIAQAVIDEFDTHAWQLTCTLAPFVQRSGRWLRHDWNAVLTSALVAARRQGDIAGQALVHWELGRVHTRLDRYVDALSHLTRALDLYRQLGSKPGQASSHLGLALMFEQQAHEAEALRHAERALDLYRAEKHRSGMAEALNAAGWYCTKLGEHQQALDFCQQALDLYLELGSQPGEAVTLDSIGYAHHQLGDYPRAIACYQSALALLRQFGDFDDEALVLIHLGDAHYASGEAQPAREAWAQALAILEDHRDPGADRVRARLSDLAAGRDITDASTALNR